MKKLLWASLAATLLFGGQAQAQQWPTGTITIVAPFAAGGAPDFLARLIGKYLSESVKQNVVVENKPGANGLVGSMTVVRAEPDGLTLLMTGLASHVTAPLLRKAEDPMKGLTHIAYIGGTPIALLVTPSSKAKSLEDYLEMAKTTPINYGTSGAGSLGHLVAEYLVQNKKVKLTPIHYNVVPTSDVIAGHIESTFASWASLREPAHAGLLRPLAVTSAKPVSDAPDLPTMKARGIDLDVLAWFSISGPPGMSPELTQKLHAEFTRILALPEVSKRLTDAQYQLQTMTPAQLNAFYAAEKKLWEPVVVAGGLQTQ